jgi:hypothetical protein
LDKARRWKKKNAGQVKRWKNRTQENKTLDKQVPIIQPVIPKLYLENIMTECIGRIYEQGQENSAARHAGSVIIAFRSVHGGRIDSKWRV